MLRGYENMFLNLSLGSVDLNSDIDPTIQLRSISTICDLNSEYIEIDEVNQLINDANMFSSLFYNIRSISSNLDEFISDLSTGNKIFLDIIGLTETRLNKDTELLYVNYVNNYRFFSMPRNSHGGGVSFFVRQDISAELIPELSCVLPHIESLFIKINKNDTCMVFGCIYRPPSASITNFLDHLESILEQIFCLKPNHICIGGDFNMNLLDSNNQYINQLKSIMSIYGLWPVIKRPTRVTSHSASLIDHIWSSEFFASDSRIVKSFTSDHFPTYVSSPQKNIYEINDFLYKNIRMFNETNKSDFRLVLQRTDWSDIYGISNTNVAFDRFIEILRKIIDDSFPTKIIKVKRSHDKTFFLSDEIKLLVKEKHKYERLKQKWPISYTKLYNSTRNRLNKLIKDCKIRHYSDKFNDPSAKVAWKNINIMLGRNDRKRLAPKIILNQKESNDDNLIANAFNEYFGNVGENLASKFTQDNNDPSQYIPNGSYNQLEFSNISAASVESIVSGMKDGSPGIDEIPMFLIKSNKDLLSDVFSYLINLSMDSGIFPNSLKMSRVTCIHKKGSKKDICNYRPISVVSAVSKILERVVYINLSRHVETHQIISPAQFGFRKGFSTDLALQSLVTPIYNAFDRDEFALAVFLDLSKAFDSLDIEILLNKLQMYGINDTAQKWFRSYVTKRIQYTKWNTAISNHIDINCGVPQGTILSPLLFSLYVNDFPLIPAYSNSILFADDSNLFITDKNIEILFDRMNHDLSLLNQWFIANKLTLNLGKTHYVLFSRRKKPVCMNPSSYLKIENSVIERQTETIFLGVTVDQHLEWNLQTRAVCNKVAKYVHIFRNLRSYIDKKALKNLYNTLVYPNLIYCNSIWGYSKHSYIAPLIVLQKKIIRIIAGVGRFHHTDALFKSYKLLNIENINKYTTCIHVHRSINDLSPINFFNMQTNDFYSMRSSSDSVVKVTWPKSEQYRQCILYRGPTLYNSLPSHIRNINNINSFKFNLKIYYML